jgi:hypothetical protein
VELRVDRVAGAVHEVRTEAALLDDGARDVVDVATADREATMTQSSALLFDDFEDGNDNLWSAAGSNNWVVEPADDGQYEYMCLRPSITLYANDDWVDYTVSVDVRPTTENFAVGIVARYQNSNTFYLAELTGNQARILRRRFVVAGTGWSTLQSVGFTAVPGTTYNIAFEVRGIQLTMYIDGQEVISLVNNGSERGTVGLRCGENTLATFDNVSVESR